MQGLPDWTQVRMVGFDVDGTLYAQRPLRQRMLIELLAASARTRNLRTLSILRAYRVLREELAEKECENFDAKLIDITARATKTRPDDVEDCVNEWIHRRPLRHLHACRMPGVVELFERVRAAGMQVGIVSDYPVAEKLSALGLTSDIAVSASDPDVRRLKPHPAGLNALMQRAGIDPAELVFIGDRPERDGIAARRAGAHALILSRKKLAGWQTVGSFRDDPFFNALPGER